MKILILLSVIAYASAATLVGSNKCTWGPSYWCSHIKHATECGAVEHCMTTVWKNQKVGYKINALDARCVDCQTAVSKVEEMLKSKTTEAKIKDFLYNDVCKLCPDKSGQAKCSEIVSDYYNSFIKIVTNLEPETVCALLGLCENTLIKDTVPHHPVKEVKSHVKIDVCQLCQIGVNEVKQAIKDNKTDDEIKGILDKICMACPDTKVQTTCKQYVAEYLPEAIQLIESTDAKTICSILGLCSGEKSKVLKSKLASVSKINADYCQLCEDGVNKVKQALKDQKTQAEIEGLLDKVCMSCPDTKVQTSCKSYVKEYFQYVIDLIETVDAKEVCSELGLCSGKKSNVLKFEKTSAALPCEICGTVMIYAKTMLENKATQTEIEDFLKKEICSNLGKLNHQCASYIDEYSGVIFQLLNSELNPNQICRAIGFCNTEADIINRSILKRGPNMEMTPILAVEPQKPKKEVNTVKASAECILCEYVMHELESLLSKNSSEQEIQSALEKLCGLFPQTIKTECTAFVKQYTPLVVKLLISEVQPAQVCKFIGICAGTVKPSSAETCMVCETLIQYVDSLLEEKSSEDEIEKVLDKVCNFLPTQLQSDCNAIVKQYTPTLIKLIEQELKPNEICKELKLCSSASKTLKTKTKFVYGLVHMTKEKKKPKSDPCTYGPAYWCYSLQNAKRCNAVDHCNKHVWTNNLNKLFA